MFCIFRCFLRFILSFSSLEIAKESARNAEKRKAEIRHKKQKQKQINGTRKYAVFGTTRENPVLHNNCVISVQNTSSEFFRHNKEIQWASKRQVDYLKKNLL